MGAYKLSDNDFWCAGGFNHLLRGDEYDSEYGVIAFEMDDSDIGALSRGKVLHASTREYCILIKLKDAPYTSD